jgi:glycosyltransferase involved in cell wall biosynthesis
MRLLIITHTFPPSKHSNAKRPFYIAKGALEAGWEVDVVTSNIGITAGTEESLNHPKLTIERINDAAIGIVNFCQKHPRHLLPLMKLINGALWPDYCAMWIKQVLRRRRGFANYDRVLAFVFPPSVLRTGQSKGLVGKNWIFDYQESVSPQFERFPRGSYLQRKLTPKLKRLERDTLRHAGRVIFTAESNRQAYIKAGLVPAAKTAHVPYFFDDKVFDGTGVPDTTFEICYYGGFDLHGDRNPITFLRAFAGFLRKHPEAKQHAKFRFYGNWLSAHDSIITELGLVDQCELLTPLPYEDYLKSLMTAPILLLVVASAHNLFMPSKIVDYFGAQRPILAFVPRGSEMHDVLVEAGMEDYLCGDKNMEEGILAIEKLWCAYLCHSLEVDSSRTSKWASSSQVSRYIEMLEAPLNR